jgi:uncharacterized membrane protein
MRNKWTSRKFWVSMVAGIVGIANAIGGAQVANDVQVIAGAVITIAVVLGYLKTESDIDKVK